MENQNQDSKLQQPQAPETSNNPVSTPQQTQVTQPVQPGAVANNEPFSPQPNTAEQSPVAYVTGSVNESANTRKHHAVRRIVIGVVIVLVLFGAVIAGTLLLGSKQVGPAEAVGKEFIQDMDTNNAPAAYKLTTPAFQKSASVNELAQTTQQLQAHASGGQPVMKSWQITNKSGQPQTAAITYTIDGADTVTVAVTLQKINGSWLVYNYKFSGK